MLCFIACSNVILVCGRAHFWLTQRKLRRDANPLPSRVILLSRCRPSRENLHETITCLVPL